MYTKYSAPEGSPRYVTEACNQHWGHSPKVSGRLQLRANACTMEYAKNVIREFRPTHFFGPNDNTIAYLANGLPWDGLEASSYAKFRGKMYAGSAQLGVSLGSLQQSREMIAQRSRPIVQQAAELMESIGKSPKAQRLLAQKRGDPLGEIASLRALSGVHLEVIFGWQPLVQDIHNACMTVIQDAAQTAWVTGSSVGTFADPDSYWGGPFGGLSTVRTAQMKVARSAGVAVVNPNGWLLERAGLLNPIAVAWDLVPWSFVVNMFSNVGGLVNSITDFYGLEFVNASTTYSARVQYDARYYDDQHRMTSLMVSSAKYKYRVGRADAPPPLIWKVPNLNWGTAAMAASLAVGRVRALSKFL
jgi:hypothetical protein